MEIEPETLTDEGSPHEMKPLTVEFSIQLTKWTSDSQDMLQK